MKKLFSLHIVLLASISGKCGGNEENFKIFRFGDENLLGTGSDKEINAADYVRVLPERSLHPRGTAFLAHTKQKVSNIVDLSVLRLAFFMGYE